MSVLGIDYGTTNIVAAIINQFGNVKVIPSAEGEDYIPSVFCFEDGEKPIVGREAENLRLAHPDSIISESKLNLGSSKVLHITKSGKTYTASDLAAVALTKVRKDCVLFLGEDVDGVVVSAPANFTDAQKQDLLNAAKKAGLKVLQLVNEPTAAAIAYSVEKGNDLKLMVVDLGGGTFDVSIAQCEDQSVKVLGTDGIADLGGRLFTKEIRDRVLTVLKDEIGFVPNPEIDHAFLQDLNDRAEQAKFSLGVKECTKITICANGKYQTVELTRDDFNEMISPFIEKMIAKCESLLQKCNLDWDSIDKVLLVGGGSKVPKIKEELELVYGRPVSQDIDGMKAIAFGAAIQAAVLAADEDGNVIYQGRAIPAPNVEIRDVTSHGIGCVVDDPNRNDICAIILPKHSPIPSQKEDCFRFKYPDQTAASIAIIQGEEGDLRSECEEIGEITLTDLPLDETLSERILVRYEIDKNGMCTAYAEDKISGKKADIQFDYSKRVNRASAL